MNNKNLETLVWLDTKNQKSSSRYYPSEYLKEFNEFCQLQADQTGSRIPTVEAFDNWLNMLQSKNKI